MSTTACDQASVDTDVPPQPVVGTVSGYADFEHDWEIVPYCDGPVAGLLHADGALEVSGTCSLLWGPYYGETFDVRGAGSVDRDGNVTADLVFDYATTERDFSDVTVTGTQTSEDGTEAFAIEARGDTRYLSEVAGGLDLDAFVRLRLRPEE